MQLTIDGIPPIIWILIGIYFGLAAISTSMLIYERYLRLQITKLHHKYEALERKP